MTVELQNLTRTPRDELVAVVVEDFQGLTANPELHCVGPALGSAGRVGCFWPDAPPRQIGRATIQLGVPGGAVPLPRPPTFWPR